MNESPVSKFEEAILSNLGAKAKLCRKVEVVETFEGETVWEGTVLIFDLTDHAEAFQCYAWEVDGEITCVLKKPPVETAQDAVRASIAAG
jgi:hypothetical protein